MSVGKARNWESLWDMEEVGAPAAWYRAIVALAITQAIPDTGEAPDFSDVGEIVKAVIDGNPPKWWPKKLGRVQIVLKITPAGGISDNKFGAAVDPAPSKDLGWRGTHAMLKHLSATIPTPFTGQVEVKILDLTNNKTQIGGFAMQCRVGDKIKGDGSGSGSSNDSEEIERLNERLRALDDALLKTYTAAPALMHSAAAVIQATRGVNAAPPWMQDGQGEAWWQSLVKEGVSIASMFLGGGDVDGAKMGEHAGQMASTALRQRRVQGPAPGTPRMLTMTPDEVRQIDPGGAPDGDYDGYHIGEDTALIEQSSEVLPEEYGDPDEMEDQDLEERDEDDEDDEDEDEDEDVGRSKKKPKNPLENLSEDEIEAYLGEIIAKRDPKAVTAMGKRLVRKFMAL